MDDDREPWWQVTGVFDPDGTGSDFGYTEGLAERGLPELHLWARPTLGDDPGLDWKLSVRDTGQILNRLAWRLIDGELSVGDTWEQTFDEGFVTVRFSVHPPVGSDEVDAFGAGDAPVLPIKWELARPPIGPPQPLDERARATAAAAYDDLVAELRPDAVGPPGWELPAEPSWDEGQPFGPRTPLVLARAAQLWQADGELLTDVLDRALVCSRYGSAGYAILVSRAAARGPGRQSAVERVEREAGALLDGLGETWGHDALEIMRGWLLEDIDPGEMPQQVWESAWHRLLDSVTAYLAVEVVADVLPVHVQTWGQGVVLSGLGPAGSPPDPRWECSAVVAAAVRELWAETPLDDLVEAALAWDAVSADERCWELSALLWTSSSYAPPLEGLFVARVRPAAGALAAWANTLATILTHRALLETELVDTFLATGRHIPSLATLVNTPLAATELGFTRDG